MMECVNCGRENPAKALVCYWCGCNPETGQQPYAALTAPVGAATVGPKSVMDVELPPPIDVPPPLAVPGAEAMGLTDFDFPDLTMPEVPPIEITPPPDVSRLADFKVQRQRAVHRPVVRAAPTAPKRTRPMLPNLTRLWVFVVGLALLFLLGSTLVGLVGAAAFGSVCLLGGIFGLALILWLGLLLARLGRQVVEASGAVYERLEVLGQVLRESVPGRVIETPLNLPKELGVADLPVSFSQLRYLASEGGKGIAKQEIDLITSAITELVARDDVVLAERSYPIKTQGALQPSSKEEVKNAVLTKRRTYSGPGQLESQIMQILRTDRPTTVEDLVSALTADRDQARRVVGFVAQAIQEEPPKLEALASPDEALAEWERYRQAIRQVDPELYDLIEAEVRRGLGSAARRYQASSLSDWAQKLSQQ